MATVDDPVVSAHCDTVSAEQVTELATALGQQQAVNDAGLAILCYQKLSSYPQGRLDLNDCLIVITNDRARPRYTEANRRFRTTLGLPLEGNCPIDELFDVLMPPPPPPEPEEPPPEPPPEETLPGGEGGETLAGAGGEDEVEAESSETPPVARRSRWRK